MAGRFIHSPVRDPPGHGAKSWVIWLGIALAVLRAMIRTREYRRLERLSAQFIEALCARLPELIEAPARGQRYRRFNRAGRAFLYVYLRPRRGCVFVDLPRSWALPSGERGARLRFAAEQELPAAIERLAGAVPLRRFDRPRVPVSDSSLELDLPLSAHPCGASASDEARLLHALARRRPEAV